MNPVGYLVKHKDGLRGERGQYYDYVLAGNGIFIEAEGNLLAARVPVRLAEIRGLAPLEPKVVLRHGLIPQRFFDLAMSAFLVDKYREMYIAVTWGSPENTGGYHLIVPEQAENTEQLAAGGQGRGCEHGVSYIVPDGGILDLHSHGKMIAEFSGQDDKDETGLKLYGVVGKLDEEPVVQLRVGVYGYFFPVSWGEVFSGCLIGVRDHIEIDIEEELYEPR